MSPKKLLWLVISVVVILSAAGCKCDDNQIQIMELVNDSPLAGQVINTLLPTFTFQNSEGCQPDSYTLHISDNSEGGWSAYKETLDDSPTYTMTAPLYSGKEYVWKVKAHKDSYGDSGYSEPTFFYTGPVCSGEVLVAPDLQDPGPAGWVEDEVVFTWTYNGGCLPSSYDVQFAWDAAFTDIYLTATTYEPYAQHMELIHPDCSTLFWRVRANDGTTSGPWSAGQDFHYVLSSGCYQWHYESDDFAWIKTRVLIDACDQTGFNASWTETLHPGCMVDGMYIVGDGTSYTGSLDDVVVNLGAGPCPSTGLDQKIGSPIAKFGVLTPGTYCVTISRDQIVDYYGPISMMDGIWTDPPVKQIVAEETIDFNPGNHDHLETFVWDEPDRPFLTFPLDFTYPCKIGPEDICGTYDFAPAGEAITILARDRSSDWKLTELNGEYCYINLPDAVIEESLAEYGPESESLEDLGFFVPPDPCSSPENEATTQPEPEQDCKFIALINQFCRLGPGSSIYPKIDSFTPGQEAEVLGISPDGYFIQVEGVISKKPCYVPTNEKYGKTEGNCDNLPVMKPPPTPRPTEETSGGDESEESIEGCTVRQADGSLECVSPCPAGVGPGDPCTIPQHLLQSIECI